MGSISKYTTIIALFEGSHIVLRSMMILTSIVVIIQTYYPASIKSVSVTAEP